MIEAGINDGDIAIIDRSVEATDGDVIVAFVNNEFTIKYLDLSHKAEGYIELRPANSKYHPIKINDSDEFEVRGDYQELEEIALCMASSTVITAMFLWT